MHAVHRKRTQHCSSTTLQYIFFKKKKRKKISNRGSRTLWVTKKKKKKRNFLINYIPLGQWVMTLWWNIRNVLSVFEKEGNRLSGQWPWNPDTGEWEKLAWGPAACVDLDHSGDLSGPASSSAKSLAGFLSHFAAPTAYGSHYIAFILNCPLP